MSTRRTLDRLHAALECGPLVACFEMAKRKSPVSNKEQLVTAGIFAAAFGLWQVHNQLKSHMEDCAQKSALLVKIVSGVAVLVGGELIIRTLNFFHFSLGGSPPGG